MKSTLFGTKDSQKKTQNVLHCYYACTHEMLSFIKRDNLNPNNYPDKLNFKLKKRPFHSTR